MIGKNEMTEIASALDRATLECRELERFTVKYPDLTIEQAYLIQDEGIRMRVLRGEKICGLKMGLTSKAKMKQMGVESPIYGVLTDRMQHPNEGTISLKGRIHPKIEPEIAFGLGRDLKGQVTLEEALDACEWVSAAMELIDSRYLNFNFTLPDVVADNCSSSGFVLGSIRKKPKDLDLGNLGMLMEVNGKASQFGASSAIYGHPGLSLAALCAMLDSRGQGLKAGSVILAGAATQAVSLESGSKIKTSVQDLGTVSLSVID
jgi:2-oxo-3-hexenedioate decarboxylase